MQRELDTRISSARPADREWLIQQKTSKVNEIIAADDIVFALTNAGVCLAYDNCQSRRHAARHSSDLMLFARLTPTLTLSRGVCFSLACVCVCSADSYRLLCTVNVLAGELIRSLFYNRCNNSIITVSVHRHDQFAALKCRTTTFESVTRTTSVESLVGGLAWLH